MTTQHAAPTYRCCSPACPGLPWPASERRHPCPPAVESRLAGAWAGHGAREAVLASWTDARIAALLAAIPVPGPATVPASDASHDGAPPRTHRPRRSTDARRRAYNAAVERGFPEDAGAIARLARVCARIERRAYADSQYALMLQQQAARAARQLAAVGR